MIRVEAVDISPIRPFFEDAALEARRAQCLRAKCGSVVVSKSGMILGTGFNAPGNREEGLRCDQDLDVSIKQKYDKTCCVHAEWNAAIDTLKKSSDDQIDGSRLYFMRVDENGDFTDAGEPYCTTCSRITMQAGIAEFALWNAGGADIYPIAEYNDLSYRYYAK